MSVSEEYFSVSDVSIAFGDTEILKEVSFHLKKGEIGCLLGPSGCGKTTLLRAIAGFENIANGSIKLDDKLLSSADTAIAPERRGVGIVFQDYALFPHLSIIKNVEFGLHRLSKRAAKATAMRWLDNVGLAHRAQGMPHELSGGEQQRVALARALAPEPELVLLDEPFSNLDVDLRDSLSKEVRELFKRNNTTALLVTHDQHEAFAIADNIGVLHQCSLAQWAPAYDIYHQPKTRFVADFVGQGVFLKGKVTATDKVETALGALTAIIDEQTTHEISNVDTWLDVLIRPDDIVHDTQSPLRAVVKARQFRGAEFMYTLLLENGESVLVLVPSHHNHQIGEEIGIRLEVDHVVVFPRNTLSY